MWENIVCVINQLKYTLTFIVNMCEEIRIHIEPCFCVCEPRG